MATDVRSVFIGVMGAPFESELTTTLLRLVDAGLRQGLRLTVWTCGGATNLTHTRQGPVKPRNFLDLVAGQSKIDYPTPLALVGSLLAMSDGRLSWYVCRHCMEERGASEQMEGVKVQSPFKFLSFLEAADNSIMLGVK